MGIETIMGATHTLMHEIQDDVRQAIKYVTDENESKVYSTIALMKAVLALGIAVENQNDLLIKFTSELRANR